MADGQGVEAQPDGRVVPVTTGEQGQQGVDREALVGERLAVEVDGEHAVVRLELEGQPVERGVGGVDGRRRGRRAGVATPRRSATATATPSDAVRIDRRGEVVDKRGLPVGEAIGRTRLAPTRGPWRPSSRSADLDGEWSCGPVAGVPTRHRRGAGGLRLRVSAGLRPASPATSGCAGQQRRPEANVPAASRPLPPAAPRLPSFSHGQPGGSALAQSRVVPASARP